MQSFSSTIWTRIVVFNSYDDNRYTTGTSKNNHIINLFYYRYINVQVCACMYVGTSVCMYVRLCVGVCVSAYLLLLYFSKLYIPYS